ARPCNGAADALRSLGDRRVDADHFAVSVDERTTRVPRIDPRVRLNSVVDRVRRFVDRASGRADDATCDRRRALEVERKSNRQYILPDLQLARVANRRRRQVLYVDL